jgi:hypothetical protein
MNTRNWRTFICTPSTQDGCVDDDPAPKGKPSTHLARRCGFPHYAPIAQLRRRPARRVGPRAQTLAASNSAFSGGACPPMPGPEPQPAQCAYPDATGAAFF